MSLSCVRNSVLVNSTSTMPVQLTKLVMSASVTVRPMVLNCRPTGRSSKQKPSPPFPCCLPRSILSPDRPAILVLSFAGERFRAQSPQRMIGDLHRGAPLAHDDPID